MEWQSFAIKLILTEAPIFWLALLLVPMKYSSFNMLAIKLNAVTVVLILELELLALVCQRMEKFHALAGQGSYPHLKEQTKLEVTFEH